MSDGTSAASRTILHRTWREEPGSVLALIAPYLEPGAESPHTVRERARAARDARVEELCAACSDPKAVDEFRQALHVARRAQTDMENHNHAIDQMSHGQLRRALMAAGRRLASRGDIPNPDDIFWLRRDEIVRALRSETLMDFQSALAERRAERERWRTMVYPPVLGAPDSTLPKLPPFQDDVTKAAEETSRRISGWAASPGRRRGRARVIPMAERVPKLAPGDILVAENAGPMWTPLFPILGGLGSGRVMRYVGQGNFTAADADDGIRLKI